MQVAQFAIFSELVSAYPLSEIWKSVVAFLFLGLVALSRSMSIWGASRFGSNISVGGLFVGNALLEILS
jgi:hypothetical protein